MAEQEGSADDRTGSKSSGVRRVLGRLLAGDARSAAAGLGPTSPANEAVEVPLPDTATASEAVAGTDPPRDASFLNEPGPAEEDSGMPRSEPPGRRMMFRAKVDLPANLEITGKDVQVRIDNLSGTGAAIVYRSTEPVPHEDLWLDLALPTRPKPLELQLELINSRPFVDSKGDTLQVLHVRFPGIRLGEQDNIIAYLNNLQLYEGKQYTVAAAVKMEIVTGRRRFAKFTGQTLEIRPDRMKLLMDDFDGLAGSLVMLTIMAPHFSDHIDVEDVRIEKVEVQGPRKAEVDVLLEKPNDAALLFVRKHYPASARGRGR